MFVCGFAARSQSKRLLRRFAAILARWRHQAPPSSRADDLRNMRIVSADAQKRPDRQRKRYRDCSREWSRIADLFQRFIRSSTISAMTTADSPPARNPATTPARSFSGRFWLTFHLPSMAAMGISTPMMALIWAEMNGSGASLTLQGCARFCSCEAVSA